MRPQYGCSAYNSNNSVKYIDHFKPKWLFQRYIVSHGHVHRTYFGGSVYVVPGIDMEQHRNIHNPHKQDTRHVGCK